MTHKKFREFLLKGRGACFLEVKKDPKQFHDDVMWACGHELAFDAQCEGSRAWYVYQMICCYTDKQPFLDVLIGNLDNCRSDGGWKLQYLAEILMCFVQDGNQDAEAALWRKYDRIYDILRSKKRLPRRYFTERDDFHMLCGNLGERPEAMVRISEDIGRLYRENPIYDGWCFDWLYAQNGKRFRKTLEKKSANNENIAAYLQESLRTEEEALHNRKNRTPSAAVIGSRLKKGSREEQLAYMERYLREEEPEARADALRIFVRCPYPGDISPVVKDLTSDNFALQLAAGLVLRNQQSTQVRLLALERMKTDPDKWFPVLIRNYEEQDQDFVAEYVKSLKTDHAATTSWHPIQFDLLEMADNGIKVPGDLLMHIYETTYCSNCRCKALRQMGRRHMLSDDILEECLYDSQEDVRKYVKRVIKRRNKTE